MTPADAVPPAQTRTLVALLAEFDDHQRATFRTVATRSGRSLTTTAYHLRGLRDRGLVTWDDDTTGTLRPLYSYA